MKRKPEFMKKIASPNIVKSSTVLRVLGTEVTLIEPIKKLAEQDLGIKLEFIVLDGIRAQRRGALSPESFDVYDQWFHDVDLIWPTQSIKPIDTLKIERWTEVLNLPTFDPETSTTTGVAAPIRRLYVQEDGQLGQNPTQFISMLPSVHNADSFAIIGSDKPQYNLSWSELLSDNWQGQVAIQADAAIGVLDLLMAFQSKGELSFPDIGNLTLEEIDLFIRTTRQYQLKNQFQNFWTDKAPLPETKRNKPILSTMWWANYIAMKASGVAITMCTPKEGYRGWFGGMAISASLTENSEGAAYEYLNWWLSGAAGAIMARNGAYISTPNASREFLTAGEWDFWYEGKPAKEIILDPYGNEIFKVGELREGGSYENRTTKIVSWNSIMDEHNFLVRLWDTLIRDMKS